jgi:hypothetical protein
LALNGAPAKLPTAWFLGISHCFARGAFFRIWYGGEQNNVLYDPIVLDGIGMEPYYASPGCSHTGKPERGEPPLKMRFGH